MEFASRAAPQKIARKARFMKSSRIQEKSPDPRHFADVTYVFLDRIVKASRDGTLRPVLVQELGTARHVTSSRVPNCFISIVTSDFKLRCDSHHILSRTDMRSEERLRYYVERDPRLFSRDGRFDAIG